MAALGRIKEAKDQASLKDFLAARNVLMLRILLRNGHRTGAIQNMTCAEYEDGFFEDGDFVIRVQSHKNAHKFVCSVVLDKTLKEDLDAWFAGRCSF